MFLYLNQYLIWHCQSFLVIASNAKGVLVHGDGGAPASDLLQTTRRVVSSSASGWPISWGLVFSPCLGSFSQVLRHLCLGARWGSDVRHHWIASFAQAHVLGKLGHPWPGISTWDNSLGIVLGCLGLITISADLHFWIALGIKAWSSLGISPYFMEYWLGDYRASCLGHLKLDLGSPPWKYHLHHQGSGIWVTAGSHHGIPTWIPGSLLGLLQASIIFKWRQPEVSGPCGLVFGHRQRVQDSLAWSYPFVGLHAVPSRIEEWKYWAFAKSFYMMHSSPHLPHKWLVMP